MAQGSELGTGIPPVRTLELELRTKLYFLLSGIGVNDPLGQVPAGFLRPLRAGDTTWEEQPGLMVH